MCTGRLIEVFYVGGFGLPYAKLSTYGKWSTENSQGAILRNDLDYKLMETHKVLSCNILKV